eukprot:3941976-Rhodomonas_salina.14
MRGSDCLRVLRERGDCVRGRAEAASGVASSITDTENCMLRARVFCLTLHVRAGSLKRCAPVDPSCRCEVSSTHRSSQQPNTADHKFPRMRTIAFASLSSSSAESERTSSSWSSVLLTIAHLRRLLTSILSDTFSVCYPLLPCYVHSRIRYAAWWH